MAHDEDQECRCVAAHRPGVMEGTFHHILPQGMGGADTLDNRVYVCPTTHYNVHEILREMVRREAPLSYYECQVWSPRPVARYAWALAAEGYRRYSTRPTLTT